jgi:ParB family chromosome partitioning protein
MARSSPSIAPTPADLAGAPASLEMIEVLPEEVTIVTTKEHHLYDPAAEDPVDKSAGKPYQMIKEFGWTHGAIELVREVVDGQDYLLVDDGRKRVKAVALINEERKAGSLPPIKLRAFIGGGSPIQQFVRMWAANHGKTPNSPLHDAQMIQAFVSLYMKAAPDNEKDRLKARQEAEHQAAVILGCSIDSVKNRMRLNDAAPQVKKALESGKIAQSDALKIVGTGKAVRPPEAQVELLKATPEKTPGKRRTKSKKAQERAQAAKPGVRGGNKRPTLRTIQKVMEALGEGHAHYQALGYAIGVVPSETYFKSLKIPTPGARVVTKAKGKGKA